MMPAISGDLASIVSAGSTAIYAVVSAMSLLLLSRQISDARRLGAAPALLALLKELEEHVAAVRLLGERPDTDDRAREIILRYLDFLERIEHLRAAGILPTAILRAAVGPVLDAHLAEPRFRRIIEQVQARHQEVLSLAQHLRRKRSRQFDPARAPESATACPKPL